MNVLIWCVIGMLLWVFWDNIKRVISLQVYLVWVRDESNQETPSLIGITLTEWGAKRLIKRNQEDRYADLTKDQWKAEWAYEPFSTRL